MKNNLQSLRYIKHRPWDTLFNRQILGNRKRDYRTAMFRTLHARTVKGMHKREVSTGLKDMSTVLVLLCIKSTQIEMKYGVYKTRVVIYIQIHV